MAGWIWSLLFFAAAFGMVYSLTRQLRQVEDRNDRFASPSDQQLRWHLRHIRQDVALIARLLMAIMVVLVFIAFRLS